MKLDRFLAEREERWRRLGRLVAAARRRPERLGPAAVIELGRLYRATAADLSIARRRWPRDPVIRRLEALVAQGRVLVYENKPTRGTMSSFFGRTYWQRVRAVPGLLAISALLLFGSGIASALWAIADPPRAAPLVPQEMRAVTEPREAGQDLGLSGPQQAAVSTAIFTNNIRVTFLAFAAGVTAGLGTALLLIFNGTVLGAVTGLAIGAGNGVPFFELVTAHGILELSCIVVAGAAGLRIGQAVIAPGTQRRATALVTEAKVAIEIILGTIPWLVLAGLVEGFVTPAGIGLPAAVTIGALLGAVYWTLVVARGVTSERASSR